MPQKKSVSAPLPFSTPVRNYFAILGTADSVTQGSQKRDTGTRPTALLLPLQQAQSQRQPQACKRRIARDARQRRQLGMQEGLDLELQPQTDSSHKENPQHDTIEVEVPSLALSDRPEFSCARSRQPPQGVQFK
jgi:hypothetical protein